MARERYYEDDYDYRPRRRAPQRSSSPIPWLIAGLLCMIILMGVALLRYRPDLILGMAQNTAANAQPTAKPTSTGAQRMIDAVNQQSTAAEQQTLQQAIPTVDTSVPPPLPVQATAAAVAQPAALDSVPAENLSPVDLGWRPVATPTTMLSPEQYAASQASEEVTFLNNELQGLTPAQQMVKVHEAEGQAQP